MADEGGSLIGEVLGGWKRMRWKSSDGRLLTLEHAAFFSSWGGE